MKKRLSRNEYRALAAKQRAMKDLYWEVFRMMTGHFPKKSKTIRDLLALDRAMTTLYYQTETEFLHDYPDMEPTDFAKEA